MNHFVLKNPLKHLPVDAHLFELIQRLRELSSLVVVAEPGTGKTTRVPPALLIEFKRKILVLEPRRIAAISACYRIAQEQGFTVGKEIGYQVRFENNTSAETRIIFLTEALLLRKLLQDPNLDDIDCVILDEFHERSVHVDIALGALRELQELARADLKIILMSATLDPTPLLKFLPRSAAMKIPGSNHPLQIIYDTKLQFLKINDDFFSRLEGIIKRALDEFPEGGDVLCFLPGRGEIERMRRQLPESYNGEHLLVLPLHGQLNLSEQRQAMEPVKGKRKIILATNVAESSITVEGVSIVVDSGLARQMEIHPRTGLDSLQLGRISKASAKQRAGRAARLGAGVVYRAWTTHDERSMREEEVAEIHRTDLAESVLALSALGVSDPKNFSWFEPPKQQSLEHAKVFLQSLDFIKPDGTLTKLGKEIKRFPVSPRLAKLLWLGSQNSQVELACEIAAIVSEGRRPSTNPSFGIENDLWVTRSEWLRDSEGGQNRTLHRTKSQLLRLFTTIGPVENQSGDLEKTAVEMLLEVFLDRLCRRRAAHQPEAKMVGGRGVRLHPGSTVLQSEYFIALEIAEGADQSGATVFQAVGIPESLLRERILPRCEKQKTLEWSEEKSRFFVKQNLVWNGLALGQEISLPSNPEDCAQAIVRKAVEKFPELVKKNEALDCWMQRFQLMAQEKGQEKFSLEQLEQALVLCCYGETSLADVFSKNIVENFSQQISEDQRRNLRENYPREWQAPSGRVLKIQFTPDQGALVEIRLQELFGLQEGPKIGNQRLTFVLLAPNYRAVQVTKDLSSFWKQGYPQVRKELRARYPKHAWPENPLEALPTPMRAPRPAHK